MPLPLTLIVASVFAVLAAIAALQLEWTAWALLNAPAILLLGRTFFECASAMADIRRVIEPGKEQKSTKAGQQGHPVGGAASAGAVL
jgi:hypothetical protein